VRRLTLWLYRLLAAVVVPLAIPLVAARDRMTGKTRPAWSDRFVCHPPAVPPGGLWIHAVSVGEVEIARRVLDALREHLGELPVTVTATTATGLALARKTLADRAVVAPCPLDLPGPVGRFFTAVDPRALVLVETELWPEMLHQAGVRGTPVAVVNARLAERSFRAYRRVRALLRPLLEPLTLVLARDDGDADRFAALGIARDRIRVTGNVKYDLARDERPLPWAADLPRLAGGRPVVVAGSTMDAEEAAVLAALAMLPSSAAPPFLVLAPRHPERCDGVVRLLHERGLAVLRRSEWSPGVGTAADVLLIDTIGELARAYGLAEIAFIGGSLVSTGGHNPLEAAAWGVPVLSGPHVANFEEVYRELVGAGGARLVAGAEALAGELAELLADPERRRRMGAAGRAVVDRNGGATERIGAELAATW
jgi:3-deoxy-D-manno-octulosonic-acid transferase